MSDVRLILASKSRARQIMLTNAGLNFDVAPSGVDEPAIIRAGQESGLSVEAITQKLADQKALSISEKFPSMLVIGSDQALDFDGEFIEKAENEQAARAKLEKLSGAEHTLISAVSVAKGGKILWSASDKVVLTMRPLDAPFLDLYCKEAGGALINCVGGYEFEKLGSWLFSSVKGDYFTILGLPLLPLINYLRAEHGVNP